MVKFKIKNKEIEAIIVDSVPQFPKYSTQLLKLANQNAQGTRAKIVGQMSELIQEFSGRSMQEWEKWYKEKHPDAIEEATNRIYDMIQKLKASIEKIDKALIHEWVEELVIIKTYMGLRFQEAIIKKVAERENKDYRLARPEEESQGIDGYIGKKRVSIKPSTYKSKKGLPEDIQEQIIFYDKKKDGITVEYSFNPKDG